ALSATDLAVLDIEIASSGTTRAPEPSAAVYVLDHVKPGSEAGVVDYSCDRSCSFFPPAH
ncbi:MAG: hypothetical protein ABSF35_17380, partial [Polyangia bacterium]